MDDDDELLTGTRTATSVLPGAPSLAGNESARSRRGSGGWASALGSFGATGGGGPGSLGTGGGGGVWAQGLGSGLALASIASGVSRQPSGSLRAPSRLGSGQIGGSRVGG